MGSFKVLNEVKFELSNALTWGVKKDKHFGYSVPIALDEDDALKVEKLSEENGTKSSLYGASRTLYLRVQNLSLKQKETLLGKGRQNIVIHFALEGVRTSKDDVKYLQFKIIGMGKSKEQGPDEYKSADL